MSGYGKDYTQRDHGVLAGLTDDDHLQYVHLSNARTVSAIHTFTNGLIMGSAGTIVREGDTDTFFGFNGLSNNFVVDVGGTTAFRALRLGSVGDFFVNPDGDATDFKIATQEGPMLITKGQLSPGFIYLGDSATASVPNGLVRIEPFQDMECIVAQGHTGQTLPLVELQNDSDTVVWQAFDDGRLQARELGIDPSNPPSGMWGLYYKSDGLYYIRDDGDVTGPLIDAAGAANPDLWATFNADSGTTTANTPTDTLTVSGGEGIDTSISGDTLTVAGEDASATNKGIAQFPLAHFSVSSGLVSLQFPNKFETIVVSGQSDIVADSIQDTLTLATANSLLSITTNAGTDTITLTVNQGNIDHGSLAGLSDDDHPQYLLADGTRALSANWDAGSFEIRSATFESDITTGTAPFIVASTTVVTNLNADLLDGNHASAFCTTAFNTIAVSGQSDVVAGGTLSTLTLAEGGDITITTDAGTDTITISVTGGKGSSDFLGLSDTPNAYAGSAGYFVRVETGGSPDELVFFNLFGSNNTWTGTQEFQALVEFGTGSFTRATGAGDVGITDELEVNGRITADGGIDVLGTDGGVGIDITLSSSSALTGLSASLTMTGSNNCQGFSLSMGGSGTGSLFGSQYTVSSNHTSGTRTSALGGGFAVTVNGAGGTTTDALGCSIIAQNSNGTATAMTGLRVEMKSQAGPGATATVTNDVTGIKIVDPVTTENFGTVTWSGRSIGLFIDDFTSAEPVGGNFEVWLDVDAGIWFRQADVFINSDAANRLDINGETNVDVNINGSQIHTTDSTGTTYGTNLGSFYRASTQFVRSDAASRLDIGANTNIDINITTNHVATFNATGLTFTSDEGVYFRDLTTMFIIGASANEMQIRAPVSTDFDIGSTNIATMIGTGLEMQAAFRVFLRDSNQSIWSSAGSTLDLAAASTININAGTASGAINLQVNGGTEVTLLANRFRFNNGAGTSDDMFIDWTTNGQIDFMKDISGTPTSLMRLTEDTLTFENGGTDAALAWPTSGRLGVNIGGTLELYIEANKMTFNNTGSANLDWTNATELEVLIGAVSVCTFGTGSVVFAQRIHAEVEGIRTQYATRAEGGVPEDADFDSDFGLPGTVGSGFFGVWKDTTSGLIYLAACDGSGWGYVALSPAL